jgi:hypothetical protein
MTNELSPSNDWRREYDRERYRKRLDKCIEYLGGKCAVCGSTENLQFDHIDPKTKSFTIATKWKLPFEKLKPELGLCQLLCWPHHIEKTMREGSSGVIRTHTSTWCAQSGCQLVECVERYDQWKEAYNAQRRERRRQAGANPRGPYKKRNATAVPHGACNGVSYLVREW